MKEKTPLISCICITLEKPKMLNLAIACFEAQTYENKQLVILYEDFDYATTEYIRRRTFSMSIKVIEAKSNPKKTLGELRNIAIEQSDGEFICQWDDDDWYHVNRLQYQFDFLDCAKRSGSILRYWIVLDAMSNRLYISNSRNWEGSILCRKELLLLKKYDKISKGEDSEVITFLCENDHLVKIDKVTGIYVYIYHGKNTWNLSHFSEIFKCSQEIHTNKNISEMFLDLSPEKSSLLIDNILQLNNIEDLCAKSLFKYGS